MIHFFCLLHFVFFLASIPLQGTKRADAVSTEVQFALYSEKFFSNSTTEDKSSGYTLKVVDSFNLFPSQPLSGASPSALRRRVSLVLRRRVSLSRSSISPSFVLPRAFLWRTSAYAPTARLDVCLLSVSVSLCCLRPRSFILTQLHTCTYIPGSHRRQNDWEKKIRTLGPASICLLCARLKPLWFSGLGASSSCDWCGQRACRQSLRRTECTYFRTARVRCL